MNKHERAAELFANLEWLDAKRKIAVMSGNMEMLEEVHECLKQVNKHMKELFGNDDEDVVNIDHVLSMADCFKPSVSSKKYQQHIDNQKRIVKWFSN